MLRQAFEGDGWSVEEAREEGIDLAVRRRGTAYGIQLKVGAEGRPDRLIPLLAQAVLEARSAAAEGPRPLAAVAAPRIALRAAKQILASSDAEWERLKPLTKAQDEATLDVLKRRFREGIPARPVAEEERDAGKLYRLLAKAGGEKLVGPSPEMAEGTYWTALKRGW